MTSSKPYGGTWQARASDEAMNTPALQQREHPTKNMTIGEKLDWLIAEAKKTKSHVQDAGHGLPGNQWPRSTDHDMS